MWPLFSSIPDYYTAKGHGKHFNKLFAKAKISLKFKSALVIWLFRKFRGHIRVMFFESMAQPYQTMSSMINIPKVGDWLESRIKTGYNQKHLRWAQIFELENYRLQQCREYAKEVDWNQLPSWKLGSIQRTIRGVQSIFINTESPQMISAVINKEVLKKIAS